MAKFNVIATVRDDFGMTKQVPAGVVELTYDQLSDEAKQEINNTIHDAVVEATEIALTEDLPAALKKDEAKNAVVEIVEDLDALAGVTGNIQEQLDTKQTAEQVDERIEQVKGANGGIAPLNEQGIIPSQHLPSYVDDVVEIYKIADYKAFAVDGAITHGTLTVGNNLFSVIAIQHASSGIVNFDPEQGENMDTLEFRPEVFNVNLIKLLGVSSELLYQLNPVGDYTISAEFFDDDSYIELYETAAPSGVIATISTAQKTKTFRSAHLAMGSIQMRFKRSSGSSDIVRIKNLQLSIGTEELEYSKYSATYTYVNLDGTTVTAEPVIPMPGKIYVDITDGVNKSYRWSGSVFVEISKSLTLGTSSSTACRGDYGYKAYQHSLKISGNPHKVKNTDVGLGNVTNDAQVKRSEMGVANGVATLDSNGKIRSQQLPSYVDDIVECTYVEHNMFAQCNGNILDPDKLVTYIKALDPTYSVNWSADTLTLSLYNVKSITIDLREVLSYSMDSLPSYSVQFENVAANNVACGLMNESGDIIKTVVIDGGAFIDIELNTCPYIEFSALNYVAIAGLKINGTYLDEATPESGKIYLDTQTNKSYRWSGTQYVEISKSLAIGETESTAFAGDRGKSLEVQVQELTTRLQELTNFVNSLSIVATDDGTGVITFGLSSLPSAEEATF